MKAMAVFITLFLVLTSQASGAGPIQEIGVEIGPNFGYLDYDNTMYFWDPGWGVGFAGGVLIKIPFSAHFSFVPGIRYSYLKNKVEIVNSVLEGNFSIEHNSVSLPLLLRYEFSEKTFFIDLGPEFALMLSSKSHDDYYDPIFGHHDETDDISDVIMGYNILACIRVGFDAHRWDIPIAISAAYHHGFVGVAEDDKWWSDWKTREISICLSYVYRFSK